MNLLALVTDDITEILIKIMQFTQRRQKVLSRNIREMGKPGFEPRDLAVEEFSESLNTAIEEYARHRRLVLCDTATIRFGLDGTVDARPVMDEAGKALLDRDRDEYLEFQMDKLLENSLNQRVAAELIRQRENGPAPL
jgi:flagellar basal body rod protein FlgB